MSDYRLSTMDGRRSNLEERLDIKSRLVYLATTRLQTLRVLVYGLNG